MFRMTYFVFPGMVRIVTHGAIATPGRIIRSLFGNWFDRNLSSLLIGRCKENGFMASVICRVIIHALGIILLCCAGICVIAANQYLKRPEHQLAHESLLAIVMMAVTAIPFGICFAVMCIMFARAYPLLEQALLAFELLLIPIILVYMFGVLRIGNW